MRFAKLAALIAILLAAIAALVWAFLPQPLLVEITTIRRGPMQVSVSAEGVTRIRDPWTVTAPLTGTVARSPVQVGDAVKRGETTVAVIRPAEPAFLDARARAQAEAAVVEAEAAVRLAEVNLARAESDLAYAQSQAARNRALAERGTIPQRALEDSERRMSEATSALDAARFEIDLHRATLARMQAQLRTPDAAVSTDQSKCCVELAAPLDGVVIEINDIDARLVQAGEPLLTVGDLEQLKIETDLLSSDAVRVQPGARATVERWGGPEPLQAHVTRVDPAGFARTSALGIEEQRVRVHLDIDSPPEARQGLGDQYRVFVRIAVWSADAVLQAPQSALIRHQDGWAVYRVLQDKAVLTPVQIGQAQDQTVEILDGLAEGDTIIAYPSASLSDGAQVQALSAP